MRTAAAAVVAAGLAAVAAQRTSVDRGYFVQLFSAISSAATQELTLARALSWKHLTVGLVGLGAVIALAMAVLLFAEVGGVRGAKVRIYVTASGARGVLKGTDVLVAGKRAGNVTEISFLPPTTDTLSRLLIHVDLLQSALPMLRRNSYAQIRPSGTIIGAPVVDLEPGTTTAPPLSGGDTLAALPQVTERMAERVEALGQELGGAMKDWRSIMTDVRGLSGTFGAIRAQGPRDIGTFRARSAQLMRRLSAGGGTVGLAARDVQLRRQAASVVARADSIGALLSSDRGTLGRFRRDGTLAAAMDTTRSELAALTRSLRDAHGTAGRMKQDSALADELEALRGELDLLIDDFKANPLRYISF